MSASTPVRAGWSTPLIHVRDVERSIRFYERLGFELEDFAAEGGHTSWARMRCEGGSLMFLAVEEPIRPREQNIQLYLYTPDLPALRARLLAEGVEVSEIRHPDYMPTGEVQVWDPDGYAMWVGHWGEKEHEAWLRHARERVARRNSGAKH
jgi:catechol 2,3-dioxygenase-like lactoylglutathione lyase family enzyme